jgi:hypothetical protein
MVKIAAVALAMAAGQAIAAPQQSVENAKVKRQFGMPGLSDLLGGKGYKFMGEPAASK